MVAYHSIFNVFRDPSNPIVPATPDGSIVVTGANVYPGTCMGALGAMYTASLQMTVTSGTPTGVVTLQVSNDPRAGDPVKQFTTASWTTMETCTVNGDGTVTVPGQTPQPSGMVVWPNGARFFRMVYTNTAGSGTMTFWASGVSGI